MIFNSQIILSFSSPTFFTGWTAFNLCSQIYSLGVFSPLFIETIALKTLNKSDI